MLTFEGKIWKDGKFWLVEVPALDIMTQGKTKNEAYEMIKDAIESHVRTKGFAVDVIPKGTDEFIISVESSENITLLIGFMLKRLRSKNKLSLAEMRDRLEVKSRSNYGQYEKGRILPSLTQMTNFLKAMKLEPIFNFTVSHDKLAPIGLVSRSAKHTNSSCAIRMKRRH